jgi:hypothetical protein
MVGSLGALALVPASVTFLSRSAPVKPFAFCARGHGRVMVQRKQEVTA